MLSLFVVPVALLYDCCIALGHDQVAAGARAGDAPLEAPPVGPLLPRHLRLRDHGARRQEGRVVVIATVILLCCCCRCCC